MFKYTQYLQNQSVLQMCNQSRLSSSDSCIVFYSLVNFCFGALPVIKKHLSLQVHTCVNGQKQKKILTFSSGISSFYVWKPLVSAHRFEGALSRSYYSPLSCCKSFFFIVVGNLLLSRSTTTSHFLPQLCASLHSRKHWGGERG